MIKEFCDKCGAEKQPGEWFERIELGRKGDSLFRERVILCKKCLQEVTDFIKGKKIDI